jgi:hypothetical protein
MSDEPTMIPRILNDADFIAKLRAGSDVFHEYTELMDQVAERMELLIGEMQGESEDSNSYQEELKRIEEDFRLALVAISADFNVIVELAVAAGVEAATIRERVTSKLALENPVLGAASGRAAF